ncbi:MAG TPA: DNA repair protein RecO [Luteimonas sp.]|nr:DNA repair protein RecO [Luteimonas sp.]
MRILSQPAYVLHARPWRETSLLLEVMSEDHGRLGIVARGIHGPRRQVLRAALQPLQHIRFDAVLRGELAQLNSAEAVDAAPRLRSDAALAAFYVSELLIRLAPRQDPRPELYALYGEVRMRLGEDAQPLAWTLRRFERDLLQALGVGFDLTVDGDGAAIDPAARYRLDPEHGPRRVRDARSGERLRNATGRALLALAHDVMPAAAELPALRRVLRTLLADQLGGRGLRSWDLMAQLGRLAVPGQSPSPGPEPGRPADDSVA